MMASVANTGYSDHRPDNALLRPWIQVVSHTDPKYGGLSAAVPALSASISEATPTVTRIEAFCAPDEAGIPAGISADEINFWPSSRRAWMSSALRSQFTEALRGAAGVHIHGIWESSTAVAASTCRAEGIPYVISAHGMLEPWALRSGHLKKLLYSRLLERRNVRGAACLHALTANEAAQYRSFGAISPIAIIPNGVSLPASWDSDSFCRRFPHLLGKRVVLFLGRLHPKKGLDLLIQAWQTIASTWPDAHLVLAGPDSAGTKTRLEAFIRGHHLEGSVTFTGMLLGDEKWAAFSAAECFILPSHSEGLSVSVLEALGMGCPVILTEACNMPEIAENQTGWQIAASAHAITQALHELLHHTAAENRAIGLRGAQLVRRRYTWPIVAHHMAELYAWINGAPEPSNVQILHI